MLWTVSGGGLRHAIQTPVQALVLITIGMLAGCLEFAWPGRYIPGAAGAALCMLGLAALVAFPLSASGLSLLLLAAAGLWVHSRRRLFWLPLAVAIACSVIGLRFLTIPPIGVLAALALALPVSLTAGLLLDIARRSREAKRHAINTGLDAPQKVPHNRRHG
jgi:membrane-bound ClpP family serine protease